MIVYYYLLYVDGALLSIKQNDVPSSSSGVLTRINDEPVIIIPISEDANSQLMSSMKVSDTHGSSKNGQAISNPLLHSHLDVNEKSPKDVTDVEEQSDCKQPLGIELKKTYLQLDYPIIADAIPKSFSCDLMLLDTNDMHVPVPVTYNVFVDKLSTFQQYVYLSGDNGSGKRMLLYHLAKEWAANRILCSFDLVYLILDTTLTSDLLKRLQNNTDTSILLLVYGISWKNADRCFQNILAKTKSFSNVKIIFACDLKFKLHLPCDCYHVVGFSQIGRDNFIDSSFITPDDKHQWNTWIRDHPFASALCFRPLYCAMLLHIFKNRLLGDNITNFTSLYRTFLVSIVLKHVSYDINSLSSLTGKDKQDFETILNFSHTYVQSDDNPVWDELSKSFGLVNTLASYSSSPFFHPSIALFMAALKNCTPNLHYNLSSRDRQSLFLSNLYCIFSLCLNTNHKGSPSSFLFSIYQAFEIQDPSHSSYVSEALIGPEMFDPLNWFVYGWCINNNREHRLHIPQQPDQIRQLAVQMIHQSSLHPCRPYLTQQVINGEAEMLEYIKARDQPTVTGIQKVHISGNLGSALNDDTLNSVFRYVKILIIECEKLITSFNTLMQLEYLQDLTIDISLAFVNSLPCDLPSTLKKLPSLKNLTLKRSPTDFLEDLFGIFSEDPMSLKLLCISGSSITNNSLCFLKTVLNKRESCLETLIFKNFSMDSSGFELLMKCLLSSNLKKVQLQGIDSIGDNGVTKIANAIKTNLQANSDKKLEVDDASSVNESATEMETVNSDGEFEFDDISVDKGTTAMETESTSPSYDKELEVDDTSISGRAISRLITVIARQDKETKKLSLFLPVKYKYDFHNIQNVFFIKQMPSLILENNLLLQPPSTSPPSMTSPPSTSPPSMTSPPSTSPRSMTSPLTSPPLKRQSDEPLGENAPNPKRQQY